MLLTPNRIAVRSEQATGNNSWNMSIWRQDIVHQNELNPAPVVISRKLCGSGHTYIHRGSINFPKMYKQPQNSWRQKGYMKKAPYWRPTRTRRYRTKCSRPGFVHPWVMQQFQFHFLKQCITTWRERARISSSRYWPTELKCDVKCATLKTVAFLSSLSNVK
jgi:hypothetical protein